MTNAVNELNNIANDVNNDTFLTQEQKDTLKGATSGNIEIINNRINAVNAAKAEAERQAKAKEDAEALAKLQQSSNGYTNEQLCEMARSYYYKTSGGYSPKYVEIDQDKGNTVVIHLYNVVNDGPRAGHTATAAFYEVDRHTGKGQNITNYTEVDLTQ